ncbi:hypothetical protein CEXT_67201, partial [Caerostris extrusa]
PLNCPTEIHSGASNHWGEGQFSQILSGVLVKTRDGIPHLNKATPPWRVAGRFNAYIYYCSLAVGVRCRIIPAQRFGKVVFVC